MSELRKRGLVHRRHLLRSVHQARHDAGQVFGTPDLPLVKIPHPLGGLSLEQVEGRALVAVPQIVKLIGEHAK